jgi:hypothetical protein
MEMLALLLVFPLLWPIVAKLIWKREMTVPEIGLNIGIVVLVVVAGWYTGRYSQVADQEVWNGKLLSKSSDHVSCSHSYDCNCKDVCTTNSKGQRSCTRKCDTCYEHRYDVDWNLHSSIGDMTVSRVDRQGVQMPSRWARAAIGDPVADTHTFTNYVKGASDSLFSAVAEQQALEKYKSTIPAYPLNVFDYHYVNRVLPVGVSMPDISDWNADLALRLRDLGPAKQVNWVVVVAKQGDPAWADALRVAWLGGKKNDVIVVFGTSNYPKIDWVRVLSWTDQELFKVQLRDELLAMGTLDRQQVFDVLEKHVKASFTRKHMRDFEYLENEIQPPTWVVILLFVLSVVGSVGLSLYFVRNDKYSSFT